MTSEPLRPFLSNSGVLLHFQFPQNREGRQHKTHDSRVTAANPCLPTPVCRSYRAEAQAPLPRVTDGTEPASSRLGRLNSDLCRPHPPASPSPDATSAS